MLNNGAEWWICPWIVFNRIKNTRRVNNIKNKSLKQVALQY